MEDTHSVGSEMGVMTPRSVIRWSSVLTLSCIATGMRLAGRTTGGIVESIFMEYVTGLPSLPTSSLKRSAYLVRILSVNSSWTSLLRVRSQVNPVVDVQSF